MANVSLKTDFKDGEKLFGQQLNNNFAVIKAALEAMNKIVWQDDPDDSVITFRGTTEEVNAREIIDGQLLYDTTTGETYIDYGSQRISTGSGNAIYIGTGVPTNPSTQLWINPEESILPINTEVVNSMEGSETNKAPSVASAKSYIAGEINDVYSTDEVKTNKVWIDGKPIYRKTVNTGALPTLGGKIINHNISNIDYVTKIIGTAYKNTNNIFLPLPHATYDNTAISCYCNKTAITIIVYTDRSAFQESYVTLEYTKTTD